MITDLVYIDGAEEILAIYFDDNRRPCLAVRGGIYAASLALVQLLVEIKLLYAPMMIAAWIMCTSSLILI